MGWGNSTPFQQYGTSLRAHRRMMFKYLNPTTEAGKVLGTQMTRYLKNVLAKPDLFRENIHM